MPLVLLRHCLSGDQQVFISPIFRQHHRVCAVRISPPDWLARVVLMLLYRSKVDENYPLLTRLTFSKCSRTGTSQEHQMLTQLGHWFVPVMYSLSQDLSVRGDVVHVTT